MATQPTPERNNRILVVDDDLSLIALISDTLRLLGGYEVAVAMDGAAGLDTFFAFQPDCVVADVRMPGLNGYQFVRALRGDPETEAIPLIILSALAQDKDVLLGLLSGVDAYLFKPVKLDDLLAAIQQALALTAEQRQQRILHLADEQSHQ